ncbi:MAG: transcriptional regulator, partial [Microbacterium sp.]
AELEELGGIRRIDDGPGLSCLAVPIRAGDGTIAGAIAFTGARHRIEDPTRVLAPLVTLARQVASYIT